MDPGSRAEITYIIVTYNAARYIRRCVGSIRRWHAVNGRGARPAIVVVDNASSDGTQAILDELAASGRDLRVVRMDRNIGFGPANNVGFREMPSRYYVLLNADAWLVGNSFAPAIAALESDPRAAVCGLPLVYPDGSPQTYAYQFSSWHKWLLQLCGVPAAVKWLASRRAAVALLRRIPYGSEYVRSHSRVRIDLDRVDAGNFNGDTRSAAWVCGAAMVLRGSFVRECGGFDPGIFLYGEDEDLCREAHRRGQRVIIVDAVPVVHVLGWGETGMSAVVADLKYGSLRYFIAKNMRNPVERALMRLLLPFHVYGRTRFYRAWTRRRRSRAAAEGATLMSGR
jgi:hypothetical protein